MKLWELFRYEIEVRLRTVSTWVFAGLLFGVSFLMMHVAVGDDAGLNSPRMILLFSILAGIVGMVVTAALFSDAATRDTRTRMHSLVWTSPLHERDYLAGRFLGALALNALLLLCIPAGLALGAAMPYHEPGKFVPFALEPYAQAYLLFLLPNLLLAGAVLFTIATLSRQVMAAFLGGVALWAFALAGSGALAAHPVLAALGDPFGLNSYPLLTPRRASDALGARVLGLPALLLWNRVFWLAVSLAVLGTLLARFRFTDAGGVRPRKRREVADAAPARPVPATLPRVPRTSGARRWSAQLRAVARRSFEEIVRTRAFALVLAATALFAVATGWDVGQQVFGASTWPVTHLVAGSVLSRAMSLGIAVLIAVFAGELVWQERDLNISEIADAAPVGDAAVLAGRFLALAGIVAVIQAVLMLAGIALQLLQGYPHIDAGLYLRLLFGVKMVDYLLLAVLAMGVHVVVNQKYVGHLVVVLCFVFTSGYAQFFGISDNLLLYGSDPGWTYSDMNGFGPFVMPWLWFKLYWAAWAILLAVVARLFWVRGRVAGMRPRIRVARARLGGAPARAAALAAVLIASLGGFIFYNTSTFGHGNSFDAAEYERRYGRFEGAPQPRIAAVQLRAEIHERSADLRGSYRLVNHTGRPIDSVHVQVHPEVEPRSITFDRPARRVVDDRELQYQVYALARPLQPGDSLRLTFGVAFRPRGFPNRDVPTAVVKNGAYFDRAWLPTVGYRPELEVANERARRKLGLPPRPAPAATPAERVDFDAIIGTAPAQTAVAPGILRREWTAAGRRYFHYASHAPLPFGAPVLASRYRVREERWNGVALQVFHHPAHTFNVERMLRGMKASLQYYGASFGPYAHPVLRIVEVPRYASFPGVHPHTILYSEGGPFLTRVREGGIDRPFFVTARETARQWWGERSGDALVTETLAQYSAMMVVEKTLGPDHARRVYADEMERYLSGRRMASGREAPLLHVRGEPHVYNHKGALAMYTLREHVGEERMNAALRRFRARTAPAAAGLYADLRSVTPDSLHPLLRDLFEEITFWDVRTDRARATPAGGQYRVTLDLRAAKLRSDRAGAESSVPMHDLVDVAVYDAAGKPLYLRPHRLRSGAQTITITVPRRPSRAGIDPLHKLIQRKTSDNLAAVE